MFFTNSGAKVDILQPEKIEVNLPDIALSLSNICRYNGHFPFHYSVAQHSLIVAYCMPTPELALLALLHDAAEAYIGDIVRPIKKRTRIIDGVGRYTDIEEIEHQILRHIFKSLGLFQSYTENDLFDLLQKVYRVDDLVLEWEKEQRGFGYIAKEIPFPLINLHIYACPQCRFSQFFCDNVRYYMKGERPSFEDRQMRIRMSTLTSYYKKRF